MHKSIGPFFGPSATPEIQEYKVANFKKAFAHIDTVLLAGGKKHLYSDYLTGADLYAFFCAGWTKYVGLDLEAYPNLKAFHAHIGALPQVGAAFAAINELAAAQTPAK